MTETDRPRRFALLGEENFCSLAVALLRSETHQVVALALTDRPAEKAGKFQLYDDWESLSKDESIDAVIVVDSRPEVLDFARQLAARGKPLIVPVWPSFPPEFVAELSLFDAEGASTLIPCFEARQGIEQLRELINDGRLGSVSNIHVERSDSDFTRFGSEHSWNSGVRFGDIDWMRVLGGDYSQVTLIRSGGDDANSFVTQVLQLAGPGLPDATCTYRRASSSNECRICVDGSEGTAELQLEGDDEDRQVVMRVNRVETQRQPVRTDPLKLLTDIDCSWRREPGSPQWRDFVRVHEISEAMQRSLRRRRTIDLHFETASERSQFKTQMATVGCFVLVYTFFASVVLLLAGAVLDPRDEIQRTSEAAGFVLSESVFANTGDQLTPVGELHLEAIADRWQSSSEAVVIVEATARLGPSREPSETDLQRLSLVRKRLKDTGLQRVDERTTVRSLAGGGFRLLMVAGRIIAFGPLLVFLVMQLLLFVARPPRDARSEKQGHTEVVRTSNCD